MNKVSYPLKLPASLKVAAARLAKEDGVSLNQWIVAAVAHRVGAAEASTEFFRRRAEWATGEGLLHLLENAPDVPPMEDDELKAKPPASLDPRPASTQSPD